MNERLKRLDCANCERSTQEGKMCSVVASRTMREMVKLGFDFSSDTKTAADTITQLAVTNPQVERIASEECDMRLLQIENTQRGYSSVVY